VVKRVMIIAGEASGDLHGAGVVRELKRANPDVEIFGVGGDRMKQEGMQLIYHVKELGFMGFAEVIKHLPVIRSMKIALEAVLRLENLMLLFSSIIPVSIFGSRIQQSEAVRKSFIISVHRSGLGTDPA